MSSGSTVAKAPLSSCNGPIFRDLAPMALVMEGKGSEYTVRVKRVYLSNPGYCRAAVEVSELAGSLWSAVQMVEGSDSFWGLGTWGTWLWTCSVGVFLVFVF